MFRTAVNPKILVFFTTFRCNLRCAMCYAWIKQKQAKELKLDELRHIFNDELIRNNIEIINITGGEPTLRPDLIEIVKLIIKNCVRLKRIDISTNGVDTLQIVDQIERILTVILPTDVQLTVSVSLDGIGATHERVRRTPNIFAAIEETIENLIELASLYPFFLLGLNMTISRLNYFAIDEVYRYASEKRLGINFTLAAISEIGVESIKVRENFELRPREKEAIISSLYSLLDKKTVESEYIQFLIKWLKTGQRISGKCVFKNSRAFLVEPDGTLYACGNFKEFRIGNIFEQPLKELLYGIDKRFGLLWNKCSACLSNCYIEEIR